MDDELLMTVHNNDGYGIDMQRIERIRELLAENAALREVVRQATQVNSMSEWNLAGLADKARAILAAHE